MIFLNTLDACSNYEILRIVRVIMNVFRLICFIAPILLIVMLSIDFGKTVMSGGNIEDNKVLSLFIKRIIMCMAIFLVPIFITVAMNITGLSTAKQYEACLKNYKDANNYKDNTINSSNNGNNNNKENSNGSNNNKGNSNGSGISGSSSIKKITLNKTKATITEYSNNVSSRGKSYTINKTKLSVKESAAKGKINWSITNGKTVAKVDSNGNVTALSGGTATVRATLKDNSKVYAEAKITVAHGLYENVKTTQNVTVKDIYTGKSITLTKGKKITLLGELKYKRHSYKNKTFSIRIDKNTVAKISGKYLKFVSYYVDDGYTNEIYENFINEQGFTSKTNYLIWVNRGTQRLMLFKKENSKWKIIENFKTSTGDSEGKNTHDSGGSTVTRFNLEVQDFGYDSSLGNIGRVIHVRYETSKKNHGNTMHVGSLPKNTVGGNSSENQPSSHGCPHLSKSFRNKLYNTYNGGSKNKLINSKVIYY